MNECRETRRALTTIVLPPGALHMINPAGMSRERAMEIALAVLAAHGRFPAPQRLEDTIGISGRSVMPMLLGTRRRRYR